MRVVLTGEAITRHEAPVHPGDWSLGDVRRVAEGALIVAGGLLSAGERVMAARLAALSGPEGRLWARHTTLSSSTVNASAACRGLTVRWARSSSKRASTAASTSGTSE